MPSLKDLKNRIVSVKSTQKITKAMQMVAAAKLRRAQAAAEAARPYAERMETVLANLASLLTVSSLSSEIRGAGDLRGRAVATLAVGDPVALVAARAGAPAGG